MTYSQHVCNECKGSKRQLGFGGFYTLCLSCVASKVIIDINENMESDNDKKEIEYSEEKIQKQRGRPRMAK